VNLDLKPCACENGTLVRHRLGRLFLTILTLGLREGEAMGLKWGGR
jgi:hypothetical protein